MNVQWFGRRLVKVQLEREILVGRLICFKKEGVVLGDVGDFDEGFKFAGKHLIKYKEIEELSALEDEYNTALQSSQLLPKDVEKIIQQSKDVQYYTHRSDAYYAAMQHLRAQTQIAICLDCGYLDDQPEIPIIAIASSSQVFIFDMQFLGQQCSELYALFEAKRPRKIVHDSTQYVEQLRKMNVKNVAINCIYDTEEEYCNATRFSKPIALYDAIDKCFNIGVIFLTTDNYFPYKHPLKSDILEIIAKRASLQWKLHEYLHHKKLNLPLCDSNKNESNKNEPNKNESNKNDSNKK